MRAEIANLAATIEETLDLLRRCLDWDTVKDRLKALDDQAQSESLWKDPAEAQRVMRERQRLSAAIAQFEGLTRERADNLELAELAEADGDTALLDSAEAALADAAKRAATLRIESLLSSEADGNDCYIEVHPGAGGTESQDWAEMLYRMYLRWSEQHGYKVVEVESAPGDEAGIKSATLRVSGANAYGWLKTESGVHRLVRISPFDSAARRHTSFASVWVYPVVDESIEIAIEEKDVRTDTYRASGAGGQHVNKTDSAVRLTHMPTGIVVACQTNRSQHRNRAEAWAMLRARLYEAELRKREEAAQALNAQKTDIGWGHQIRSYVLHPYRMVKDLRTGVETSDTDGVLGGDLDAFMAAALAQRIGGVAETAKAN
ncbi:MAG: peptide chain release factor 2 [Alphaproteobacteria bacterium]|nr:peptide chain release factor 2 [Alphaproteobacteria bacterium]